MRSESSGKGVCRSKGGMCQGMKARSWINVVVGRRHNRSRAGVLGHRPVVL